MEHINGGMLEVLKNVAFTCNKIAEHPVNGENDFGKLLEQKNSEIRNESTSGKSDADTKETAVKEEVTTEKPKSDEEKGETCDVAREVAAAQIVWMLPETAEEQAVFSEEAVGTDEVVLVGEMTPVTGEAAEENMVETSDLQMAENGEIVTEETAAETNLAPDEVVGRSEAVVNGKTGVETERETIEHRETDETGGEVVVTEAPLFKDVEAAPIKVAEAPAQTEAPEVEKQVSDKLIQILESGENRVELQLNPVSLGKMTIELTRNGDGILSIVLSAENAQTRGLLEKHIDALQETLVDRGQQNVQIEVSRGEETQKQTYQQQDMRDDNGSNQQQQRRRQERSGEDFLQQLRLGLIDPREES